MKMKYCSESYIHSRRTNDNNKFLRDPFLVVSHCHYSPTTELVFFKILERNVLS